MKTIVDFVITTSCHLCVVHWWSMRMHTQQLYIHLTPQICIYRLVVVYLHSQFSAHVIKNETMKFIVCAIYWLSIFIVEQLQKLCRLLLLWFEWTNNRNSSILLLSLFFQACAFSIYQLSISSSVPVLA